jgi:hypothetical protein
MRTIFCNLVLLTFAIAMAPMSDQPRVHAQQGKPAVLTPRLRVLVPAYFYPAGAGAKLWSVLLRSSAEAPIVAIVNPNSGPGQNADPNYVNLINQAQKTRITLIGYVHTSYGKRALGNVQSDVDQWLKLYPGIQGIFVDEQASGADILDYYTALYKYIKQNPKLGLVVSNPGTVCDEGYLSRPTTDVANLSEAPGPFDASTLPGWVNKYLPGHVSFLSYNVPAARTMTECIRAAAKRNFGYVYVTDGAGGNPWGGLPSYWQDEVGLVRQLNQ